MSNKAYCELENAYRRVMLTHTPTIAWLAYALRELRAPVIDFFANVYIMCDDNTIRARNLQLLYKISLIPSGIADPTLLKGF